MAKMTSPGRILFADAPCPRHVCVCERERALLAVFDKGDEAILPEDDQPPWV
jgi:hypothetical protein